MTAALILGASVNVAFAALALARRSLTPAGALAGLAVGLGIWWSGGLLVWSLLALFFVTSTVLSRVGHEEKRIAEELTGKSDRRDALQVLANGGPALLFALLWKLSARPAFLVGAAAALAAANADTWASELGLLSRRAPVSLIGLGSVSRGISGGVTLLGLAASVGGSALISVAFAAGCALGGGYGAPGAAPALIAGGFGFLGSIVDSILGSTLQARYRTAETGDATERSVSTGGLSNELVGGLSFVTNDLVNAASCMAVSSLAALAASAAL